MRIEWGKAFNIAILEIIYERIKQTCTRTVRIEGGGVLNDLGKSKSNLSLKSIITKAIKQIYLAKNL